MSITKLTPIYIFSCYLFILFKANSLAAEILSPHLSVTTSANPESNAIQSFIIINPGEFLKEGITRDAESRIIGQQTPFVIEYTGPLHDTQRLSWRIDVVNKQHGKIKLLSKFKGNARIHKNSYRWVSDALDATIRNRHRLVFRPDPFQHQPQVYKKGKGPKGKRQQYGGGTRHIDQKRYNPKISYQVILSITSDQLPPEAHRAIIKMDYKDMIRQEYINHYNIKRYGRGENGNIPIPMRHEISELPENVDSLKGNPLTESKYKLVINDGMLDLAKSINRAFNKKMHALHKGERFYDLDNKPLPVPDAVLWLSSGWRNPERNEWYSNAVNGIHQRGGAVDFVILLPPNSKESAIAYWILHTALKENENSINAFWQLETNGRPMTRNELELDIEPHNGIPDAFDKADHLHANIHY